MRIKMKNTESESKIHPSRVHEKGRGTGEGFVLSKPMRTDGLGV